MGNLVRHLRYCVRLLRMLIGVALADPLVFASAYSSLAGAE